MAKRIQRRDLVDLAECILVLILVLALAAFAGNLPSHRRQSKAPAPSTQASPQRHSNAPQPPSREDSPSEDSPN